MTTADYALLVSLFSAVVAVASFVWNVWQKFIYPKARLRIGFYEASAMGGGFNGPPWPTFLCVSAVNHGPTEVIVNMVAVRVRRERFWQRPRDGILNPIPDIYQPEVGVGPFAGGLPKKLAVGESISLYFPRNSRSFARERLLKIGLIDNFGRFHTADRKQIDLVRKALETEFADVPYVSMEADAPGAEEEA